MTSPVPAPKETYQNGLRTLAEVHSGFNVKKRAHPLHEFVGEHFPLPEFFLPTPTITLIMVRPKSKEISRPTLPTGSSRRGNLEEISLSGSPSLNLNCRYFYAVDSDPKDPNRVT